MARRLLVALAVVVALGRPSFAEPSDTDRAIHLGGMVTFGGLYLAIEFPFKETFAAETCRWCDPPGFDRAIRSALKWDHPRIAARTSDVLGFAMSPLVLGTMLVATSGDDRSSRRTFDDLAPVVESAIVVSLLQSTIKYTVRRSRPHVRFAAPGRAHHHDDNTSFFSGHTSAVFAETFAAGIVAHERGYAAEPAIWATGITFGVVTGYLRIAADMHYTSDVVTGMLLGSSIGLAIPYLLHRSSLRGDDPGAVSVTRGEPRLISFGGRF